MAGLDDIPFDTEHNLPPIGRFFESGKGRDADWDKAIAEAHADLLAKCEALVVEHGRDYVLFCGGPLITSLLKVNEHDVRMVQPYSLKRRWP